MKQTKVAWVSIAAFGASMLAVSAALADMAAETAEDIIDIRAPLPVAPWWRWPLIGLVTLCAVAALTLSWRYWQQRKQRGLTALQRALLALDQAEKHAQHDRAHEWAQIVAQTLREALAARVGVNVLPQTTAELARADWAQPVIPVGAESDPVAAATAEGQSPSLPQAPELLRLLSTCDIARFARAHIEVRALLAETERARELVQQLMGTQSAPTTKPKAVVRSNPEPLPS